jgi:predicted Zn finger-like uncharacterized protein
MITPKSKAGSKHAVSGAQMRLTCPNCDAQYEVPDEVMPTDGRDVQCSACGCTWFQAHPDHPEAAPPDVAEFGDDEIEDEFDGDAGRADSASDDGDDGLHAAPDDGAQDVTGIDPDPATDPDDEPDDAPEPRDDTVATDGEGGITDEPEAEHQPQSPAPAPRRLGPVVADILRDEARREAELRAAEAGTLETQPELGLDAHPDAEDQRRAREADARKARMRGETPAPLVTRDKSGGRRNVFPDIDDINATLRKGDPAPRTDLGPVHSEPEPRPPRRGSFLRGFAVALLLVAGMVLIYNNAPRIAAAVPGTDPMISAYVALVDQARIWLDAQAGGLTPK